MEEKFINDIVEYIVTDPGHNMTEAAEHFKCSRPTIKRYIAMLSDEKNLYYNQFKAMRVKISLEKQLLEARSKAGSISRRKIVLTETQALEARYKNLYEGIPLRQLAKDYNCSHMTIHNAIKALPDRITKAQDEEIYLKRQEEKKQSR